MHEDAARRVSASRAPGDLNEELEGAFGGAKILDRQRRVGIDDADQRDERQIVPLRHHLRADENVDFACAHLREDLLDLLAARDIAIETSDPCLRKRLFQRVF